MDNYSLVRYDTAQSECHQTGLLIFDHPLQTMERAVMDWSNERVISRCQPASVCPNLQHLLVRVHIGKIPSHLSVR